MTNFTAGEAAVIGVTGVAVGALGFWGIQHLTADEVATEKIKIGDKEFTVPVNYDPASAELLALFKAKEAAELAAAAAKQAGKKAA